MGKKYKSLLAASLLACFFVWLGEPDKGGIERCKRLSGLTRLKDFVDEEKIVWAWNPLEVRFCFSLKKDGFDLLKKYTDHKGYEPWSRGGGSYGSFDEESVEGDPLYYTSNGSRSKDLWKIYYRPKNNELNVIYFNSR